VILRSALLTEFSSSHAALAAASSPLGVIGGALAGHGVATLVAITIWKKFKLYFDTPIITYFKIMIAKFSVEYENSAFKIWS